MDRNLDGVYFRMKRGEKWTNVCFSDMTAREMMEVIKDRDEEWKRSLCGILEQSLTELIDFIAPRKEMNEIEPINSRMDEKTLQEKKKNLDEFVAQARANMEHERLKAMSTVSESLDLESRCMMLGFTLKNLGDQYDIMMG